MSIEISSLTEYLLVDVGSNVMTITLNRPEALNALRPQMLKVLGSW